VSMLLCAYSFSEATYSLSSDNIAQMEYLESNALSTVADQVYDSDVAFKNSMKGALGEQVYKKYEGEILEKAISMNAILVLIGIFAFIASFAFSLGPVMWVMLSELYPNKYRGLAIGFIGFINGFSSWLVSRIFPWELSTLGNATTFLIYGVIAALGFFLFLKILPETKGQSLEEIEAKYAS